MPVDPRKPIVAVMARLSRETQLHLDERERHFRITDAVIIAISLILVILAVFNVYYVRIVYKDLDGIVENMDSMYRNLEIVDADMVKIADRVNRFVGHIDYMKPLDQSVTDMATRLPSIRVDMQAVSENMQSIGQDMALLGQSMISIDQRVHLMTGGVAVMRENVRQIANPMGKMNPFLP